MKKPNIVQLNNDFIKDANQRKRFEEEEIRKHHRFIGLILIVITLLFILPTYNLVSSYVALENRKQQIIELQKEFNTLEEETKQKKELANRLKDTDYVEKYARAKYSYKFEGEVVLQTPELLPK
ncbi:FtsB family cell division protein [Streptococcus marimammalium]|uniref:FtsB family cell division protein n=1 Tax=Streptococcus marimammalium TaxID=269666 RepID=UPI0003731EBF|nr:septum formation initiator family protein [Streptococcus marimammalium]